MGEEQVGIRLPETFVDVAQDLVPPMARDPQHSIYGAVTRATVLRVAMLKGVQYLEETALRRWPWFGGSDGLNEPGKWRTSDGNMVRVSLRVPTYLTRRIRALIPSVRATTPPLHPINASTTMRIAIWAGLSELHDCYDNSGKEMPPPFITTSIDD